MCVNDVAYIHALGEDLGYIKDYITALSTKEPVPDATTYIVGKDTVCFEVLDPKVQNHLREHTPILIREFYPVVWSRVETKLKRGKNAKALLTLLGAPGIGKSVGLGMGYLLHKILKNKPQDVQCVAYTTTKGTCWMFDITTSALSVFSFQTGSPDIVKLSRRSTV